MFRLLSLVLLFLLLNGITYARQAMVARVPKTPAMAIFNFSTASHWMQGSSNSRITSTVNGLYNPSLSAIKPTAPNSCFERRWAINIQDIRSGFCAIGDNFCSFKEGNGPIIEAKATNFSDQCLLWDHTCTGNRTLAIQRFFDITFPNAPFRGGNVNQNAMLLDNDCFRQDHAINQSDCNRYNSPQRLSDLAKIKDWMRSHECIAAADEFIARNGNAWDVILEGKYMPFLGFSPKSIDIPDSNSPSCCGTCNVYAGNVDLYYWLEPDANLSCLSIIDQSSNLPLGYGATTATDYGYTRTYWGCTVTSTETIMGEPGISTTWSSYLITAEITTIGSLSVKVSSISPWSSSLCLGDDTGSRPSNHSMNGLDKRASIYGREHSLFVAPSITQANGLPISTVVSGDFTFTSPSVYAYFRGMIVNDNCGGTVMSPTMLSFSKGELSTIDGHLGYVGSDPFRLGQTSKQFDLGDLPCPPQSVMEANWYKPQPGEPYRPLIAMPSQLKSINPWFSNCKGDFFAAYDPPSILGPAKALVPPVPSSDPKPHTPVPSPTADPGSGHKGGPEPSVVVPANIATLDQPKATNNIASVPPKQTEPDPGSQSSDPATQESSLPQPRPNTGKPNSDPQDENNPQHGNDPKQGSDSKLGNDPNKANDSKQGNYPNKLSDPEQDDAPNKASDPKQDNDPKKVSDPKQVNSNGGQSGQESHQQPNSHPDQVHSVPQNDPNQADDANPLTGFSNGQVKTINNQVIQPLSHGIAISGTTLTPGAPPISVSGTLIHFDSSALIIGTSTVPLSRNTGPIITTIAGHVIQASSDAIVVAGTTLTRGSPPMTLSGTPIYLGPSALVVGTSTIPLAPEPLPQIIATIAGQAITAAPNIVTIAGTILKPEAPDATVDGTLVSLNTAGQLIIGSKTIALQDGSASSGEQTTGAFRAETRSSITTTLDNGQVITAGPAALEIPGTTLTPGAPAITVDRTLVSLRTDSQLVLGSKTVWLGGDKAGSSGRQTVGVGGLIMGGLFGSGGPFGPFAGESPSRSTRGNISTTARNATYGKEGGVQVFVGEAARLKGVVLRNNIFVLSVIGLALRAYGC